MGFFNFIETFFFISLGITFVLILLLVYHFKERIGAMEKKSESLLEIINNIVKELNVLRNTQLNMRTFQSFQQPSEPLHESIPIHNTPPVSRESDKIKVNITENDTEDSDDSDYESDETEDEEHSMPDLEEFEDVPQNIHFEYMELPIHSNIKVINLDVDTIHRPHEEHETTIQELASTNIEDEIEESWEHSGAETLEGLREEIHPIQVEKIEPLEKTTETVDTSSISTEVSKEVYRKMNLNTLKTFVITKGLCSDPSKMKKTDLLKLIETELFFTGGNEEKNIV